MPTAACRDWLDEPVTAGRAFWLAFVGFFLLGTAWAGALPVNGTYDEKHHIIRAYAVADGQWLPDGVDHQRAPADLLPENADCAWNPRPPRPASCQRPVAEHGLASVPTNAARYNPVYYLPVGVPIRLVPDGTGILLGRLVSALLSALLLGAAVWAAAQVSRLTIAAVALVATPTVVNLAGAINPSGLEISAGVLLFAALLALFGAPDGRRRTLLALAGVAAFLLLTIRHLGPVLLAIDLLAVALLMGPARVRAELRRRDARVWFGGFAAAGLAATVAWFLLARSPVGEGPAGPLNLSAGEIVDGLLTYRLRFYVRQIVGQFGYGETTMSPYAILLWYALIAVVVLPALWRGGARVRLVMLGLLVAGFGFLVGLEVLFLPKGAWFSHSRYALPVLAGVVLIAAWGWRGPGRSVAPWYLPVALVAATLPVHGYALARVMTRFEAGIEAGLNPFAGSWRPPMGPVLPFVCVLVGVAMLTAAAWGGRDVTRGNQNGTPEPRSTRTVSAH